MPNVSRCNYCVFTVLWFTVFIAHCVVIHGAVVCCFVALLNVMRHYTNIYFLAPYVIYQTRETVFHRDIQTPRRELKIRRAAEYF